MQFIESVIILSGGRDLLRHAYAVNPLWPKHVIIIVDLDLVTPHAVDGYHDLVSFTILGCQVSCHILD